MTSSIFETAVPVFKQMLGGLSGVLAKAQAHAEARKIEPDALLQARLFPDMFALQRQVRVACDFANSVSARLAGEEVPSDDKQDVSFADLQARIAKSLAFINGLAPEQFEGSAQRDIVTQAGTPKEKRFTGSAYLLSYGLPHFFFHVTSAYNILRHNGIEVGKKDYIGSY